ncbi:hypothetical protein U9M48_037972 [Paspalum notatum var. saurae]|uniref:Uncharacterized protein n=1 Tax=Paspalum notatum var. saurae TaxID=547442 RepID=A0AAQ3X9W3_PASNO
MGIGEDWPVGGQDPIPLQSRELPQDNNHHEVGQGPDRPTDPTCASIALKMNCSWPLSRCLNIYYVYMYALMMVVLVGPAQAAAGQAHHHVPVPQATADHALEAFGCQEPAHVGPENPGHKFTTTLTSGLRISITCNSHKRVKIGWQLAYLFDRRLPSAVARQKRRRLKVSSPTKDRGAKPRKARSRGILRPISPPGLRGAAASGTSCDFWEFVEESQKGFPGFVKNEASQS